jgi:hypothetical protein
MTAIDQGTVAVYESKEDTTAAVRRLGEAGFPIEQVSIITQNLESTTSVHGFVTTDDAQLDRAREILAEHAVDTVDTTDTE